MSSKALAFIKDLGHKLTPTLSVAVQRGNSASVLGTVGGGDGV